MFKGVAVTKGWHYQLHLKRLATLFVIWDDNLKKIYIFKSFFILFFCIVIEVHIRMLFC